MNALTKIFARYTAVEDEHTDETGSFLENLVPDVFVQICLCLHPRDVLRLARTSTKLYRIIKSSKLLWKYQFMSFFHVNSEDRQLADDELCADQTWWYQTFRNRYISQTLYQGYPEDCLSFNLDWNRAVMVGLDGAGKTSILYALKLGTLDLQPIPTFGFNVETLGRYSFWDIGGEHRLRPLWKHYTQSLTAVIWVVDASDAERLEESSQELEAFMKLLEDPENVALLVFANKFDKAPAVDARTIAQKLNLEGIICGRWFVQPCDAKTKKGLNALLKGVSVLFGTPVRDRSDFRNLERRPNGQLSLGSLLWLACCCGCCNKCLRRNNPFIKFD